MRRLLSTSRASAGEVSFLVTLVGLAYRHLCMWQDGEDDISAQLMRLLHSDGNGYFGAAGGIGDDNRATSQSTGECHALHNADSRNMRSHQEIRGMEIALVRRTADAGRSLRCWCVTGGASLSGQ